MVSRDFRKRQAAQRKAIARQFERHRRANLLARPGPHHFIMVLDHLKPTYNVGKIFRSADAFGAREVHLVGLDFFNPGPAAGSFKYVPARFHADFDPVHHNLRERGYTIFTAEPAEGTLLTRVHLPKRSAFVLGHEEFGISFDRSAYPDIRGIRIPQFGRVESLNVSVAASILMYAYVCQHNPDCDGHRRVSSLPRHPRGGGAASLPPGVEPEDAAP